MRGGTSKAIFIKKNELPSSPLHRDQLILSIFGSPDIRQIDGLGGSDITTSKVAIISPTTRNDADIDYNFGQVQLETAEILWNSNCGNISSAVGPYAIDEGMVRAVEPITKVRIYNVNTNKILVEYVPVKNGRAIVEGDYILDGVPGTGAKLDLDYAGTVGAVTGKLLPTGNVLDILDVPGIGKIEASIVDIANSVCFIDASSVGAIGTESPPDIRADKELMAKLEAVRNVAAYKCGYIRKGEDALVKSPIQPMISFVSPSVNYQDYGSGNIIKEDETDFLARILYNQLPTDTFPGTATVCIATAAMIEGTVVNRVCKSRATDQKLVSFGHARGINQVRADVEETTSGLVVKSVIFSRTARRIMDGVVYVKRSCIDTLD